MLCIFCDKEVGDDAGLLGHLIDEHLDEVVLGRKLLHEELPSGTWLGCYCGRSFPLRGPAFIDSILDHWRKNGGWTAHLLKLALKVK